MKNSGLTEGQVFDILKEIKKKDTNYSKVLSAMCTPPHRIAVEAHMMFIESNMGDSGLFPGTNEMEISVIDMLSDLMHGKDAHGHMTTGGTESNIQALRSMRNCSESSRPNVVVPESAHFSFDKIADILRMEVRKASMDQELKVDMGSFESLIDEDTVGLVGVAGSTEFGQIDPIGDISRLAVENSLPLHVDAAFGGFVIPFLEKNYSFDFSLDGVTSIALDPHKMGLGTIPAGVLLFRGEEYLSNLQTDTPYLTTQTQHSLTGTRSGGAVAATYGVLNYLGKDGYLEVVDYCMDLTEKLVDGSRRIGIETLIEPVMNVVALRVPDADVVRKILREKYGWMVSITRNPRCLRLVLMPHLSTDNLELFLQDLEKAVKDADTCNG